MLSLVICLVIAKHLSITPQFQIPRNNPGEKGMGVGGLGVGGWGWKSESTLDKYLHIHRTLVAIGI